jgi:hypothetical protein
VGQNGKYITSNGSKWVVGSVSSGALPDPTSHANEFLSNDGSGSLWAGTGLTYNRSTGMLTVGTTGQGVTFHGGASITGASGALTLAGATTVTGNLTVSGTGGVITINHGAGTTPTLNLQQDGSTIGRLFTNSGTVYLESYTTGNVVLRTNQTPALTLNGSTQAATFAGNLTVNSYIYPGAGTGYLGLISGHLFVTGPSTAGKILTLQSGNATGGINFRNSVGAEVGFWSEATGNWSFTGAVTATGAINTDSTTDATSTTTGSIQTDGGLGVAKNLVTGQGRIVGVTNNTSTSITLDATHHVVTLSNASPVTVNLPAIATNVGREYRIKNIGAGTVTIDPNASETIEGSTTFNLTTGQSAIVVGTNATNYQWSVF